MVYTNSVRTEIKIKTSMKMKRIIPILRNTRKRRKMVTTSWPMKGPTGRTSPSEAERRTSGTSSTTMSTFPTEATEAEEAEEAEEEEVLEVEEADHVAG